MNKKSAIAVAVSMLMLVGCTSIQTGTQVSSDQASRIEKGKTTEDQVVTMFGKPDMVNMQGTRKTLSYSYNRGGGSVGPGGILVSLLTLGLYTPVKTKSESTSLMVVVENGVVQDYTYSQSGSRGSGY